MRHPRRPLDQEQYRVLADTLGDTPHTVISVHLLRRGLCKAYVAGDLERFEGAIVQANSLPSEPTGFGSDPQSLWALLQAVQGWDCILVDSACAPALGAMIARETAVGVRFLDDVCSTLSRPVRPHDHQAVRQVTLDDIDLVTSAPAKLRDSLYESPSALLSEGIVACAIKDGRIVSTALTAARTARHAEIGVFTLPRWRGRGFSTAAAAIVAQRAQQAGQTPVWSAGATNLPSLRVAHKLGFTEVSRKTYVILDRGA